MRSLNTSPTLAHPRAALGYYGMRLPPNPRATEGIGASSLVLWGYISTPCSLDPNPLDLSQLDPIPIGALPLWTPFPSISTPYLLTDVILKIHILYAYLFLVKDINYSYHDSIKKDTELENIRTLYTMPLYTIWRLV